MTGASGPLAAALILLIGAIATARVLIPALDQELQRRNRRLPANDNSKPPEALP